MKQRRAFRVLVATATCLIALVAITVQTAFAVVAFPKIARDYEAWLARAMDQCNPATVSVVSPNDPTGGCLQTNSVTDSAVGLNFGRLRVSQRGRVALFAAGLTAGDQVSVQLMLRVTRTASTKHPPASRHVTFADTLVTCPPFFAHPNGFVVGSTSLTTCLGPDSGLATGNIEILDAAVINAVSGKVIGVPGVVRR